MANGTFKMKMDIYRHGPRLMPNNCKNLNPPFFSLPTTFKVKFTFNNENAAVLGFIYTRMPRLGNEETAENSTSEASTSSKEIVPFEFLFFFLITSNIQAALLRAFHRNVVPFTCS
jgi:hypothetical protein